MSTPTLPTLPTPARPQAVVLGPETRAIFGHYHPQTAALSRTCGVVLCNPFGYEAMCIHRSYVQLADRLNAAGFPVLRFDYRGTGDSSGASSEPGRVRAWLDSIGAAIDELSARAGVQDVSLFGVRLGATLAATVAAERGDVASLVAWAPIVSGKAYMRELRAFRRLQGPEVPGAVNEGEDVAGFRIALETIAELTALDLAAAKVPPAPKVLVIPRDDLPGREERLARHLTTIGAHAEYRALPGYAGMVLDPQAVIVPHATLEEITGWLSAAHPATQAAKPASTAPTSSLVAMEIRGEGASMVREHPVTFGEDDRLFGIITEPSIPPSGRLRPTIVFLNVGANHRVGPNRMYVTLARALAERGLPSLRFDVAGIGDSRAKAGEADLRLYSKDSIVDVKSALAFLARARGADKFVLVGLCSGAYLAFHATLEEPRVTGQVLLNPQTFAWKEGDSLEIAMRKSYKSTDFYKDSLFRLDTWTQAIRGRKNVRGVAGVLRDRLTTRARGEVERFLARVRKSEAPATDVERAFRKVADRGTHSLVVFSANDGGRDMLDGHLGLGGSRMTSRETFRMRIVEDADHTFTPIASQRALHELLVTYLSDRFA